MDKPVLVVLAAGMGSRYGGLKQIDPIDAYGNIIMDFALYDARRAGFEKAIFIIKKEDEADFMEAIGDRISRYMDVDFAYQELSDLPEGYSVPEGRQKPWGTAQALLSCKGVIHGPFATINSDDYYGAHAFQKIYDYLLTYGNDDSRCAMVGYILKNTLSENGHVSRGVCEMDEECHLLGINERKKIIRTAEGVAYTPDDGETWVSLAPDSVVSMNLWGFAPGILNMLDTGFEDFLKYMMKADPLKSEYLLPTRVSELLQQKVLTVDVLQSPDKWYGVTYRTDKEGVMKAIQGLKDSGLYPQSLWGEA